MCITGSTFHNRLISDRLLAWVLAPKPTTGLRSGAVAADGNSVLATGDIAGQKNDARLLLVSASGQQLNQTTVGGADNDYLFDTVALTGGGFALAGQTFSAGNGGDGWLVRVDAAGNALWQAHFGSKAEDLVYAMAVVPTGFLFAGATQGNSAQGADNWLVATDAYGNVRWERQWGTAGVDAINNLSVLPSGDIMGVAAYNSSSGFFRRDPWGFDGCPSAGVCKSFSPKDCDDRNPCTVDTCLPTVGCKNIALAAGSRCSQTAVCTNAGKCSVPEGMIEVPAGKFWMGCAPGDITCGPEEQPQHEVTLSAYAIDKHEVTLDQYAACVSVAGCKAPSGTNGQSAAWNWDAVGRGSHPINGLTRANATAYCAWQGKRLPTEAEWEKAARGGCELYPNQDCKAMATLSPWGKAAPSCTLAHYNQSFSGCGTSTTAPIGLRPGGASPYGVHDMAGNVSEWVSDSYSATWYANSPASNPVGPSSGSDGIKRGGAFSSTAAYLRVSERFGADVTTSYTDQGVRCAVGLE